MSHVLTRLTLSAALLVGVLSSHSHAGAILGPSRTEIGGGNHGSATPSSAFFQSFNAGYRWSMSGLTYTFDGSFAAAFGASGENAFRNAFSTWDVAFGALGAPADTSFIFDPGTDVFDLESIALHEIGHALGLHHPDQADNVGRNFDKNGNAIAATGKEVMNSTIAANEVQRKLTQDDIDIFTHLYSQANAVLTLTGTAPVTVGNTFGPGDVSFTEQGTAVAGGLAGATFDIFAEDLGAGGPLALVRLFGGSGTGGNINVGGSDLGGFLDGVPLDLHGFSFDNANHGNTLVGVDIVFNSNAAYNIGINSVPEPGTIVGMFSLATFGVGIFIARRRRDKKRAV